MSDVKLIAFYLPQFHPIPENDRWWGPGFTEWTNVTRGRPFFPGHYQPRLPADLGFYDLRLPETRRQQADLARASGVHGFCYYYYWFNGHRLLERPLDDMVRSGEPDFPFCICWANENWTRRWDGAEHEVLMHQEHSPESDRAFIHDVLPILRDPRYVRVGSAPLLLVYRPGILPDPAGTSARWREAARAEGIPALHLCAVQSFGLDDPRPLGFDSAVEFPPHGANAPDIADTVHELDPRFSGRIFDYRDVARRSLARPPAPYRLFRGVMTGWDNTARRGASGTVFVNATPKDYETWLRGAVASVEARNPAGERFVFVNAWNEWAEGAHLEPDQRHGQAYLEATRRALSRSADWREIARKVRSGEDIAPDVLRGYVLDMESALDRYEEKLQFMRKTGAIDDAPEQWISTFGEEAPLPLRDRAVQEDGLAHLDQIQVALAGKRCALRRPGPATLTGWAFAPGVETAAAGTRAFLMLRSRHPGRIYYAPLMYRLHRRDVVEAFHRYDKRFTKDSGFSEPVSLAHVQPGEYRLGVVHVTLAQASVGFCSNRIVVE